MRMLPALAFILLFANAASASTADEEFAALADQYVLDLPRFSPVSATLIGDIAQTSSLTRWTPLRVCAA